MLSLSFETIRTTALKPWPVIILLLLCGSPVVRAQHLSGLRMNVTYVTSAQLYFDAGNEEGVAPGDSVVVYRAGVRIATARVSTVAPHSSAARIVAADSLCRPGDTGVILTEHAGTAGKPSPPDTSLAAPAAPGTEPSSPFHIAAPRSNVVRGRLAFQYIGEIAADSRLNIQEPALLAYLNVTNLEQTGMSLSLNTRFFSDFTNGYVRYGAATKSRIDVYDLRLSMDRPADHFGFTVGRMVSRYVSGLGLFDGGEVFARAGGVIGGVAVGRGIEQTAPGIQGAQTKSAIFVGYQNDNGSQNDFEGTVAYARQTLHGNLDRQFIALQGTAFLGSSFQAFGSAEVGLNGIRNGGQTSTASLSNASLFLNYYPAWWLSGSVSYDETRPVYLFETMKSIPDSLFDDALQHGFRASVTTRLSRDVSLTGSAGYRIRQGDVRPSHTLTGSGRATDLAGTRINAGFRYANSVGPYLNGDDFTVSMDRRFFSRLDLTLRYDHYAFGIGPLHQVYLTQTFTMDAYWDLSRTFYSILRGDYVLDNTMNSVQFQVEVGVRL